MDRCINYSDMGMNKMSRYYDYFGLSYLKVIDFERLKKLKERTDINGNDLRHLLHLRPTPNIENNCIDWQVDVGIKYKLKSDKLETDINHFSPDDCTVQMFLSELALCVEDFAIIVKDEEFPAINDEKQKYIFAWLIENVSGKLKITELHTIKYRQIKNISILKDIDEE